MRIAVRLLLALLAILAIAGWFKREEITRLMAVNSLFDEDRIVGNFSSMGTMFHTAPMGRGDGPVSPLPEANLPLEPPPGLASWLVRRSVAALVVLKNGTIAHESYHLGTGEDDLRISWSVAKSWLSALMGILVVEGDIASLDDKVEKYVPELVGSAYEGATIRDVLHMASGVAFNEDYFDYYSDINRMGRALALGGSLDSFAANRKERRAAPGEEWHYVSIDTHVLGMVARAATGRSLVDLMEEKIVAPLGLEAAPYYLTDGYGVAFALGGLNLRTRDYARFGQMILDNGYFNGHQIVPAGWVLASTRPSAPTAPGAEQYGLHWWMPKDAREGEFYAIGVYGQYIYIDRASNVVIAVNSADRGFRDDGVRDENIAMFRSLARAARP